MKRITAIALSGLLVLSLTSWKAECNPPICEATGTCTKDVIGKDPIAEDKTGTPNG